VNRDLGGFVEHCLNAPKARVFKSAIEDRE
jgi:hypothetical protein